MGIPKDLLVYYLVITTIDAGASKMRDLHGNQIGNYTLAPIPISFTKLKENICKGGKPQLVFFSYTLH